MGRNKQTNQTGTIREALDTGASEIDSLKDEMCEWRDNMDGANMSHLPKYEEVSECADTLENADMQSAVDTLLEALELAQNGREGVEPCPPHAFGKRCPACQWDGKKPKEKPFTDFDQWKPARTAAEIIKAKPDLEWMLKRNDMLGDREKPLRYCGRVRSSLFREGFEYNFKLELAAARAHAKPQPPTPKVKVEAVTANPSYAGILTEPITWIEYTSRRGLSRAARMGNALCALEAALVAIEEKHEAAGENADSDVNDALDEIRSQMGDVEGVNFPGMY